MAFQGWTNHNTGTQNNVSGNYQGNGNSYTSYPQALEVRKYSGTAYGGSVVNGDVNGTINHGMPAGPWYPPPGQFPKFPIMDEPLTEEPEPMEEYDRGHDYQTGARAYQNHPQFREAEPDVFSHYGNERRPYHHDPQNTPHRATRPGPRPVQQYAPTHSSSTPSGSPWSGEQPRYYAQPPPTQAPSAYDQGSYGPPDIGTGGYSTSGPFDPNAQTPPLDSGYGSGTSYNAIPKRDTNPFRARMIEDKKRNTNKKTSYCQ